MNLFISKNEKVERVYRSLDDVPDRGSYFSTMVVR